MAKSIECEVVRTLDGIWAYLNFDDDGIDIGWERFRHFAPTLAEDIHPGQNRYLILTQTKRGIKLEIKK